MMPPSSVSFLSSWMSQLDSQQGKDLTTLVAAHTDGKAALDVIKHAAHKRSHDFNQVDVEAAIREAEKCDKRMDELLKKMLPSKHFNEQHDSRSSMTAYSFFDVAEITDLICEHLPLPDIMALQQVNKRMLAITEGSTKIQDRMNLETAMDADIMIDVDLTIDRSLKSRLRLPNIRIHYEEEHKGRYRDSNSEVVVECAADLWTEAAKPGNRLRRLVATPSWLSTMHVNPLCCMGHQRRSEALTITSMAGITIGNIYDAYIRVQNKYRYCPHAAIRDHQADGTVRMGVIFTSPLPTEMKVRCAQMLLDQREEEEEEHKMESFGSYTEAEKTAAFHARIRAYQDAKRRGRLHIPLRCFFGCRPANYCGSLWSRMVHTYACGVRSRSGSLFGDLRVVRRAF